MKHHENRFHMTPEQSLFLAKKKWDEALKDFLYENAIQGIG